MIKDKIPKASFISILNSYDPFWAIYFLNHNVPSDMLDAATFTHRKFVNFLRTLHVDPRDPDQLKIRFLVGQYYGEDTLPSDQAALPADSNVKDFMFYNEIFHDDFENGEDADAWLLGVLQNHPPEIQQILMRFTINHNHAKKMLLNNSMERIKALTSELINPLMDLHKDRLILTQKIENTEKATYSSHPHLRKLF